VTFAADSLAGLMQFRALASSRFTETLRFYILNGTTTDPDTLEDVEDITVLHTVAGRVKYPTLTVSERSAVGQVFATQSVNVHVAVGSAPDVRANHFVTVTASTADPALVGRVFRVTGNAQSGQVTAHRFPVEQVS
jgi:hypothetical protein